MTRAWKSSLLCSMFEHFFFLSRPSPLPRAARRAGYAGMWYLGRFPALAAAKRRKKSWARPMRPAPPCAFRIISSRQSAKPGRTSASTKGCMRCPSRSSAPSMSPRYESGRPMSLMSFLGSAQAGPMVTRNWMRFWASTQMHVNWATWTDFKKREPAGTSRFIVPSAWGIPTMAKVWLQQSFV